VAQRLIEEPAAGTSTLPYCVRWCVNWA